MDQKVVMWPLDCALINEAVLGHNGIGYLDIFGSMITRIVSRFNDPDTWW